jgi:RNA polymerase nonessential primary-like sigma factor
LRRTIEIMESARDKLVLPNFRLILKEVFRYQPSGMKRSDLFQEGILGLHRAVFRFDPGRLTRFSTYATYWIRQAIRKALIDRSRLIRVPQAVQEELRNPDTHLTSDEVQRVRRIMRETVSISAGDDDNPEDRLSLDMIQDSETPVTEKLHTGSIPMAVSRAMTYLDSREREVIRRRFGLEGEHLQTLEEIGTSLHLSRERIRQIETDALKKMSRIQILQEVYDDLEDDES